MAEWDNVVTIELRGETKTFVRIKSTKEAAKYLIEAWPGSRDAAYHDAVVACAGALRGLTNERRVVEVLCKAASSSNLIAYDSIDAFEAEMISAIRMALDTDLQSCLEATLDKFEPNSIDFVEVGI